jgi:hypothetical protein
MASLNQRKKMLAKEFTPTERRFLQEVERHRDGLLQDVADARLIIEIDKNRPTEMVDSQRVNLELALFHINASFNALDAVIKGKIVGTPT